MLVVSDSTPFAIGDLVILERCTYAPHRRLICLTATKKPYHTKLSDVNREMRGLTRMQLVNFTPLFPPSA